MEVTGSTQVAGLFASPVGHSRSPAMHNAAAHKLGLDLIYVPFNVPPDQLEHAVRGIRALGMVGVNVTIPHKERVGAFLDWVSEDARLIGSVNTIHNDNGVLRGYSTDGAGFLGALRSVWKDPSGARTVVLGAGGAARATVYALAASGAIVTVANRTVERAERLASDVNALARGEAVAAVDILSAEAREAIAAADLLVNCTSVGMYPHCDAQPIPAEWLHQRLFVFDQVYNPSETGLLRSARLAGAAGANGARMLVCQGAVAFEIWTGVTPPLDAMEEAVLSVENKG